MVVLDWDDSFSMQAYVTNPGFQRMALTGYITEQRADGIYAAPLLPQLFRGADGSQLSSWRQYLPSGQQTVLSRSGGLPEVPKEEIYWRKLKKAPSPVVPVAPAQLAISPIWIPIIGVIGGIILIKILGKK